MSHLMYGPDGESLGRVLAYGPDGFPEIEVFAERIYEDSDLGIDDDEWGIDPFESGAEEDEIPLDFDRGVEIEGWELPVGPDPEDEREWAEMTRDAA